MHAGVSETAHVCSDVLPGRPRSNDKQALKEHHGVPDTDSRIDQHESGSNAAQSPLTLLIFPLALPRPARLSRPRWVFSV